MAITIRSRQGTQIGYKGTSGGSVSWVNQAGQAGRQITALGHTMINVADDVKKFFNDEVSESEIRQQVDDMQVAYLKQSRAWHKNLREGGLAKDANGVPTQEIDPNYYTDISNQNHDTFWKDYVEDKGYDPKAVSAFGVYFQDKGQEAFNKADQWGMKQRYSKLRAKDAINIKEHMITITTDPLVENKQSAFDALQNMHLSGAPHRDGNEWKKIMDDAQTVLVEEIATTNAYGQQGRNLDPSDLVNGYTEVDYSNAIKRINADPTLTKDQRKKITDGMRSNRKTRIAVEKTARAAADNATQSGFSALHSQGKLTLAMIENSNIDFEQKMYWKSQLEGGSKKPWKGDYNTIKDTILSGTWSEENDIARTPEDIKQAVRVAANEKNIPADEVEKLMKDVEEVAKASPITVKKKAARVHAKSSFTGDLSTFEKLMLGQKGKSVMASEAQEAAENKLWKYDTMIEKELAEGRKNGLTWNKMLSPSSPDYIVNDIIDTINSIEPNVVEKVDPVEETDPTLIESAIDAVSEFDTGAEKVFDKVVDLVSPDGPVVDKKVVAQQVVDSGQTIHKVYGRASYFPLGTTPVQAKAQTDSSMAEIQTGDARMRVVFDSEHPGYSQYLDGRESMKAWKERMAIMGYDITSKIRQDGYRLELQDVVLTDEEIAAEMERIANEIEAD